VDPALTIRRATRADFPVVMRFHRELYVHYRDRITAPGVLPLFAYKDLDATLREDVEGLLRANDTWVLLAEERGVPVGYITGHLEVDPRRVLSRRGIVEDWLVLDAGRGRGVGRALMAELERLFREQRCTVMESGTWAFNQGAREAHRAAGFTEIEVKMRKPL
jgi:GNAT superfamily N-acetyltransferase